MEKKINIAELLKDCPKGMELDCIICNGVKFIEIDRNPNFPIVVRANNDYEFALTKYGQVHNIDDAKCVIFPKGKTTWEGFVSPCKFKDGDAIVSMGGLLALFSHIEKTKDEKDLMYYHCILYTSGTLTIKNDFGIGYVQSNRLATEEEKQKLFDAIKANGYKWNAETKTLEKLIEPKFKVGDIIKHKSTKLYCILGEYSEGISAYRTNIGLSLTHKDLRDWELAPNKFDISALKPFDKVLVRDKDADVWEAHLFSRYCRNSDRPYICIGCEGINEYKQCIPYDSNKELLGTFNDCNDFYKT